MRIKTFCDKNCIANLDGQCCVGECKGQISTSRPWHGTAEEMKKAYEVTRRCFDEDFEYDESILDDED